MTGQQVMVAADIPPGPETRWASSGGCEGTDLPNEWQGGAGMVEGCTNTPPLVFGTSSKG